MAHTFTLSSPAFGYGADIPLEHTCEGVDVSPALSWSGEPPGTQTFVLIVDDPDAPDPDHPKRVWTHWLVYNIPSLRHSLPEAASPPPDPAEEGLNDWGQPHWGGPCPPTGKHRYFFRLYALDTDLDFPEPPSRAQLERAMENHVLGVAELLGRYESEQRRDASP